MKSLQMRNSLFQINHAVESFTIALNQEKKKINIKMGLL